MADKKPHKPSKADIAKQFELPERQSKITTLLNQAGQAYCICRSSDSSRFMIGCDACEEWYHGDCINISEREARYIRQYYCDRCRLEDPSLTTRFKLQKREHEGERDSSREESKKKRKEHSENKASRRPSGSPVHSSQPTMCGNCSGCVRTYDCGRCDSCVELAKISSTSARVKIRCKQRLCVNIQLSSRSKPTKPSSGRSKHHSSESRARENSNLKAASSSSSKRPSSGVIANEAPVIPKNYVPQQCLGQSCVKAAVPPSKYCSHNCGMRLASARIYQVLPQRIQEWSLRPCVAEASDRRTLAQLRSRMAVVRAALDDLDQRRADIDVLVERAKNAPPANPDDEEPEEEGEMSMYCITCGHEIHSRTAVKHMEKCFNKYEAQSSFGSVFKTRIEGQNMFCDFYNAINRTYCKRLRVLCPEHSKEPKVSDTDVCGCPLVRDVFIPTGEFCRAPRKSCLKHHAWEKLRRAEVDLERVRHWLKIDDLVEQERNIRYAMASRAGVLGLMLHSTYNHEVMELITSKMQPVKKE